MAEFRNICSHVVVRKWVDIEPMMEFRCFVVNGRVTAISQYYSTIFFPELASKKDHLAAAIIDKLERQVYPRLRSSHGGDPPLIIDFCFTRTNDLLVVEVNPWGESTHACLFDWRTDAKLLHENKGEAVVRIRDAPLVLSEGDRIRLAEFLDATSTTTATVTNTTSNNGTNPLNYGIIGCGMMGREHIQNIKLVGAIVVAIFEPDATQRSLAKELVPNALFVDTLDALLLVEGLTAVVIASPNHCHLENLTTIARVKPSLHILCEKPLCTSLEQAKALREVLRTLRTAGSAVWCAMEYRYMPPVAALLERSLSGHETGGTCVVSMREHRYPFLPKVGDWNRFSRNTGGTLTEKCCHFWDLMRVIMGRDDPIRIFASGGMNANHLDETYNGERPDILDNAFVVLEFPGNRRAMLELCMFAEGGRYQEEIACIGPRGKLEVRVPGPSRFWPPHLGEAPVAQLIYSPREPKGPQMLEIPVPAHLLAAGDHNGSTYFQHLGFASIVKGEKTPKDVEVTAEDGLKAVLIGLAAEQSARTGMSIDLASGPFNLNDN